MRLLEIILTILLALYLLWPLTGRNRPPLVNLLPFFAILVLATHSALEGVRWQMIPLYAFTAVTAVVSFRTSLRTAPNESSPLRPLSVILNLSLLALSTTLPILLPIPAIPAPSGPYSVGTRIYELIDPSRRELFSGVDEPRRFQIQVWYPADADASAESAPWMANAEIFAPSISGFLGLPSFFLDHLALVKVPATQGTPPAAISGGFPIILFSHGWNGFNAQNTGQALQLASHGFIVVGIQHPYGAVVTVFADGTIARNNPSALPDGVPDEEYEIAADKLADQWAGDMAFTLDYLEAQNNDPAAPFYNALDLSRTGVYGHSTGGGASIQFCGTDPRCKAILGMDPFMRPVSQAVLDRGLSQPSIYMFSQDWADELDSRNNRLFNSYYEKSTDTHGAVFITGTKHYDFSDVPLLSPLAPQLGLKGPINGARVTVIVTDYLLSFFEAALNGGTYTLFDAPSPYAEIQPKQVIP